ncbi:hypothetical protein [Nostoc sp. DSM 114161]|uniref:hypothetical protein n=1 Tax=Nostoc sp. DSM 114161 TaxID=3440143 RepID=UPI004045B555
MQKHRTPDLVKFTRHSPQADGTCFKSGIARKGKVPGKPFRQSLLRGNQKDRTADAPASLTLR